MTTPQQPQQQPPPPGSGATTAAVAGGLVAAVGMQLVTAATAVAAVDVLVRMGQVQASRLQRLAMLSSLQIAMTTPPGQTGAFGSATLTTERLNHLRRAQFVVMAARRIAADLVAAHSQNRSLSTQLTASVQRERRYYAQHLLALWNRSHAGAQTDTAAMTWGNLLGWHATRDAHTSAECLAADGKNFYADHMPLIGYPGAVHPHCRCQPGSPFPGARLLPSHGLPAARTYRRAA